MGDVNDAAGGAAPEEPLVAENRELRRRLSDAEQRLARLPQPPAHPDDAAGDASAAAHAAYQTALLELGDRLLNIQDPGEMGYVAAEIIGKTLGVIRAGYGTIDAARGVVEVVRDWAAPGVAHLSGTRRFMDDRAYREFLARGQPIIYADTQTDAPPDSAAAWLAVGARSVINIPVFEYGVLVAVVYIHADAPRTWPADEIAFLRNLAERTRSAVERRRAENGLRELNETLERQVAERTADRNRLWRLSRDIMLVAKFDGTIAAVNPAWTTTLGWTEAELIGRPLLDLVHPDDVAASAAELRRREDGNASAGFENRYRHRDGSYRWLSWNAVPGGGMVNAVGRDFTAEREKSQALALSEARLRALFDTSYQFHGLLAPDGIVIDANATSLAAINARRADVVGRPFWETPWFAATPGLPGHVRAACAAVAAGELFREELVGVFPDGQRTFDFSMRPMRDAHGAIIAIVAEAIELTERRRVEEQLRQSQKMEAVGQLTGGLAHDFNNLLTGITGSLELLRTRVAQGRVWELQRYITAAESAASRAAALTHRLLAFSRRQTLDPKAVRANALIADMADLIRRTVGPEITVRTALAPDLWTTLCDPNQLESALLNLSINARDAMPDGGALTVETANADLDERTARARDMELGEYVSISVIDTGVGMTPEVVARAFDPFFTTKPIGQGTGLGLSMIYGFVKQSGGQVRIHSQPGVGTAVRLLLPRHVGADETVAEPDQPGEFPRARAGETVLVVDDEPTVRMLVAEVLAELGYAALEAADAQAGLAALRATGRVDLLISDVGLPGGMNGRQFADAARGIRPHLKVLFITGYAEASVLDGGSLGRDMQMMTKPFSMSLLATRIQTILGSRGAEP